MDIVPILSTIILTTTFGTLILAVMSYLAFKLRDRRRPAAKVAPAVAPVKTFFVRYRPPEVPASGEAA